MKKIKNDELNKLQKQIAELKAGWQRTQADFDNFRKRAESSRQELIRFANVDLLEKIFPIMDNFRRAFSHTPEELKNNDWVTGIKYVEKQLEDILINEGLAKIEPQPGEEFNPQFHEAISSEENKAFKSNQIIASLETGYKLGDKVIRPAKVRVTK